jgi:molecular chaperone DnaK
VLLLDVTPLSLGIETQGGVFTKLVERNTTIPIEKQEIFSTAEDSQTAVTVRVFQGERPMAADNRLLGQFNLEGISPAPRGMPQIEVTFDLDQNGILNVRAKDKATGKEASVRIEDSAGLSDADIQRMKSDAEAHADEDKRKREIVDLRNQADQHCFQLEKMMKEQGDQLSDVDKAPLNNAIDKVRKVAEGDDVESIKSALVELEQASQAFSKAIYERAQACGTGAGCSSGACESNAYDGGSYTEDEAIDAEFEVKS